METLNFTDEETVVLHDMIKTSLGELRTEISYTDDRDFKAALKHRRDVLKCIQGKLSAAIGQPA